MATLTAPSSASARTTRPQTKVAAGSISSRRVRPFTRATRNVLGAPRQQVLARAAEPEAAAVEEFSFSFTDAKKGNEYSSSDVEAALSFFEGAGAAPGDVNSEFVENVFGVEDASFFDDMDNNDAYDDEFIAAGIPEAAPKQRQGRQRGGDNDGDDGDSDEIAAAKEISMLKQREEEMVLDAELEETGLNQEKVKSTKAVGPAVWDWLNDVGVEDEEEEVSLMATSKFQSMAETVLAQLPTDEEVFADLRKINLQDIDLETREDIEFLLDDYDLENELKLMPEDPEDALSPPAAESNVQDDLARIDALVQEVDADEPLDLDLSELGAVEALEDDGRELSEAAVDDYVATLRAAGTEGGAELTEDELKEAFGDSPLQLLNVDNEEQVTMDDVDLTEPEVVALDESELEVPDLQVDGAEELSLQSETEAFRAELIALRSIPDMNIEVPAEEEMGLLEQYLSASEQFLAAEEERKMQLLSQVQAGELPEDVLEEEDFVDVEMELLNPDMLEDDDDVVDDFEDEENWQERIVELTRVTKVVKGGKLMGFRCTAIVGNGNGLVGVGCQAGREIAIAVKRALVDAKKSVVRVPLVGAGTVPHRVEAKFNAARCVILPAADGTGVLAGGAIRSVLELAGVQNVLAKRLGCRSLLNNARCAVAALEQLRTLQEVSKARGVPMERLLLPARQ